MTNEDKLREQAAKPILLRIQADIERASPRLKPWLGTVAKQFHLDAFTKPLQADQVVHIACRADLLAVRSDYDVTDTNTGLVGG